MLFLDSSPTSLSPASIKKSQSKQDEALTALPSPAALNPSSASRAQVKCIHYWIQTIISCSTCPNVVRLSVCCLFVCDQVEKSLLTAC